MLFNLLNSTCPSQEVPAGGRIRLPAVFHEEAVMQEIRKAPEAPIDPKQAVLPRLQIQDAEPGLFASPEVTRLAEEANRVFRAVFDAVRAVNLEDSKYSIEPERPKLPAGKINREAPGDETLAWIDSPQYKCLLLRLRELTGAGGRPEAASYFIRLDSPLTQSVHPRDAAYPDFYSASLHRQPRQNGEFGSWTLVIRSAGDPEVRYLDERGAIGAFRSVLSDLGDAAAAVKAAEHA